MEDITIKVSTIMWFLSAIVLVNSVVMIFVNWKKNKLKPHDDLKEKIRKDEVMLLEHEKALKDDDIRFKTIEDAQKITNKCMLALIDHELTGNSVDKLRSAKNDLQDYLINR